MFGRTLCQLMEKLRPYTGNLLNFLLLIFVYIISPLPVHEDHKHYIVWAHVVSVNGSATALNRESLCIFFSLFILFFVFLFLKRQTLSCFGARCFSSCISYSIKQGIPSPPPPFGYNNFMSFCL